VSSLINNIENEAWILTRIGLTKEAYLEELRVRYEERELYGERRVGEL